MIKLRVDSNKKIEMEVVGSKILVMFLLAGFCILLGFIPLKLGNWFRNQDGSRKHGTIFSSLLCYGGGVLLATSLIHMLPEVSCKFLRCLIYNFIKKSTTRYVADKVSGL